PRGNDDVVHGDVYDLGVDSARTLQEMDAYENAESPPPTPYEREMVTVTLADGRKMLTWVYWYRGPTDEQQFIAYGSFEFNCDPEWRYRCLAFTRVRLSSSR